MSPMVLVLLLVVIRWLLTHLHAARYSRCLQATDSSSFRHGSLYAVPVSTNDTHPNPQHADTCIPASVINLSDYGMADHEKCVCGQVMVRE